MSSPAIVNPQGLWDTNNPNNIVFYSGETKAEIYANAERTVTMESSLVSIKKAAAVDGGFEYFLAFATQVNS